MKDIREKIQYRIEDILSIWEIGGINCGNMFIMANREGPEGNINRKWSQKEIVDLICDEMQICERAKDIEYLKDRFEIYNVELEKAFTCFACIQFMFENYTSAFLPSSIRSKKAIRRYISDKEFFEDEIL